jgi:hypothetical protein
MQKVALNTITITLTTKYLKQTIFRVGGMISNAIFVDILCSTV